MGKSFPTKAIADKFAKFWLDGLPSPHWRSEVGQDGGWEWHVTLYCAPFSVHIDHDGLFFCLLADEPDACGYGSIKWKGDTSAPTPLMAVKKAIALYREWQAMILGTMSRMEPCFKMATVI